MNLKVSALLLQLDAITQEDLAMLSRDELVSLSDAGFALTGNAELELEGRVGFARWIREQFQLN